MIIFGRHFTLSVFSCMLPGTMVLVLGFFAILHSWLNAFAEMTRFADRMFYKVGWLLFSNLWFCVLWKPCITHSHIISHFFKTLHWSQSLASSKVTNVSNLKRNAILAFHKVLDFLFSTPKSEFFNIWQAEWFSNSWTFYSFKPNPKFSIFGRPSLEFPYLEYYFQYLAGPILNFHILNFQYLPGQI